MHWILASGLLHFTAGLTLPGVGSDRIRLGAEPAVPHVAIDNRLTAATPLQAQVADLLARAEGGNGNGLA
jgi:hypothetical protein